MTTEELDQTWQGMSIAPPALDTRATFCFLLEAAAAGWHPERMTEVVTMAGHTLDRNVNDSMYGNLCNNYGGVRPTDPNVGLFCMQSAIVTWERYRTKLPLSAQNELKSLMDISTEHVLNYAVAPSYTNIYLMKAFDCIGLGESLDDVSTADLGYQMLGTWISSTKTAGIGEYLSPTYYGVDLESLALIERLAGRSTGRAQATTIQNLLWADIAAHWFVATESMSGAHSRDHDYLLGHGKSDIQLQLAGWLTARAPNIETYPDASSTYFSWARSTPPTIAYTLVGLGNHVVQARCGSSQRTAFISHDVSLSSTSGSYCMEDKLMNVHFAAVGTSSVNMCYVMDSIGDPYGQLRTANALGNSSIQHLTPTVMSQQSGSQALFLISEELPKGSAAFNAITGVHSDILIPSQATIYSGNSYIPKPASGQRIALNPGQPVFVHLGNGVAAVRVVYATTTGLGAASLSLVNDGGSMGACRLLCEHASVRPAGSVSVRLAMHLEVAQVMTSAAFTAFRTAFMTTTYHVSATSTLCDVSVTSNHSPLHLALNIATNKPSLVGALPTTHVLDVDGIDIGTEILDGNENPSL